MLFKKVILENFAILTGKHLCCSLFFNKVADIKKRELLKKTGVLCEYLNPIKFRAPLISARFIFAPLILAQLNKSYIRVRLIFALIKLIFA